MRFTTATPEATANAIKYIRGLDPNQTYKITITKWRESKTWEQLAFFNGVLVPLVADFQGESSLQAKNNLKENAGVECEYWRDKHGNHHPRYKSCADMSVDEMRHLISETEKLCMSFGIRIPYRGER